MFGRGERVAVEADGSFIGAFLIGSFRKPDFGRRNQSLLSDLRLAYDDTDAFKSTSARTRVGLERQLGDGMTVALGRLLPGPGGARTRPATRTTRRFGLLSLPARFEWDRSDDRLDPSSRRPAAGRERAVRRRDRQRPAVQQVAPRLRPLSRGRRRTPRSCSPAARRSARWWVSRAARFPANLRFYAGGGGSVRGFGYQLAGKLNDDDDPIGGRSLLELSGEVRVRITETHRRGRVRRCRHGLQRLGAGFLRDAAGRRRARACAISARSGRCASTSAFRSTPAIRTIPGSSTSASARPSEAGSPSTSAR